MSNELENWEDTRRAEIIDRLHELQALPAGVAEVVLQVAAEQPTKALAKMKCRWQSASGEEMPPEVEALLLGHIDDMKKYALTLQGVHTTSMAMEAYGAKPLYQFQQSEQETRQKNSDAASSKGEVWRQAAIEQWLEKKDMLNMSLRQFCMSIAEKELITEAGDKGKAPKFRQVYDIMREARSVGKFEQERKA